MYQDPFAPTKPTTPTPTTIEETTSVGCEQVTKDICEKSNTTLLATAAGYVIICVAIMSVVRMWWNKRGDATMWTRRLTTVSLAAGSAGVLVAVDPFRGQNIACCLASGVFKASILFQDSTVGRAILLGLLPAVVLFILVAVAEKAVKG